MSFSSLGLSEEIVRAVTEQGYTTPTPIQMQAVPAVLGGGDLLAGAQTGTGKTAGFTLPLLQRLSSVERVKVNGHVPIRALILTPTRELAAQVEESVRVYGKYLPLTSACIFGGVGINPQIRLLKQGVDILVATPGRLLDHMQQNTVDLKNVQVLILDEADRMLDMGFIRDIKKILAVLPKKRQNLLFSATFSDEIKALADGLLNSPAMIEVARRNSTVEVIGQKIHPVDRDKKHPLLAHLIKTNQWNQVLVFTRTKHGANKLVEQLARDEITAMAIHGNKSQAARTRALADFKDGKLQALIATDIAARGIDIDQLPHVVNYDLPNVSEDYVHRIGRTGRAGATGSAVSLVCVDERDLLNDIERFIKREIPVEIVPGFEPDPKAKPQPIQLRSEGHRGGGGGGRRPQGGGGGRSANGGGGGGNRSQQPKTGGQGQAQAAKPRQGGPAKPQGPSQGPAQNRGPAARPASTHRSGGRGR
jgi:ATP-dependent RNA helicase RhlE